MSIDRLRKGFVVWDVTYIECVLLYIDKCSRLCTYIECVLLCKDIERTHSMERTHSTYVDER
jgi:hypothetical protein